MKASIAKNYIGKNPDIAFLADLMGHESLETTRTYLRRTASGQRVAVDATIGWRCQTCSA